MSDMRAWHQGVIETDRARLRYFRSGGELPSVVLVHGFTDSALYFTRVAEALATDYDVVAYDARGHGISTRLSESGGVFDDDIRVRGCSTTQPRSPGHDRSLDGGGHHRASGGDTSRSGAGNRA
jgi:pimeloyl-ACP methyl ester carboxylesterase